jgi:hypothetical protein
MEGMIHRQSIWPCLFAVAGLAVVVAGAFLPWMYVYGHRALDGFEGGWIIAWLRGHFSDTESHAYPVAWQWGADGWIALALAFAGVGVAIANRRMVEQRYDRVQFAAGTLVVAIALFNVLLIWGHAGEHLVVQSGSGGAQQDRIGMGLWLTLFGGLLTALGALLGNTPEFLFAAPDRAGKIAGERH